MKTRKPRVVQHALQLIGEEELGALFTDQLLGIAADENSQPRLLLEVAKCADQLPQPFQSQLLEQLMQRSQHSLIKAVIAIAIERSVLEPWELFEEAQLKTLELWLPTMLPVWLDADRDTRVVEWIASKLDPSRAVHLAPWIDALCQQEGTARRLVLNKLTPASQQALTNWIVQSCDEKPENAQRLLLASQAVRHAWIRTMLAPNRGLIAQESAMQLLGSDGSDSASTLLLEAYSRLTPQVQILAARICASRPSWTLVFLRAIEAGEISASQVPLDLRQSLAESNDNRIRTIANRCFGQPTADRAKVIDRYAVCSRAL